MILNGYDTFIGRKTNLVSDIISTLKTLTTTGSLRSYNKGEIFVVDNSNGNNLKGFVVPITLTNFRSKTVTVIDIRHLINKNNIVINQGEYDMLMVAASLQQAVATGSKTVLHLVRPLVLKTFAKSIAIKLGGKARLTLAQMIDLEIILGHYYNCMLTEPNSDFGYVSQNVIEQALNISQPQSVSVIEQIGYISGFKELVETIKTYPTLSVLSNLDLGGFIGIVYQTWTVFSGFKEILGMSIELPHLYTGICYASAINNVYKRTGIGSEVDARENNGIDKFVNTIKDVYPTLG